jgi:hypothetical protein
MSKFADRMALFAFGLLISLMIMDVYIYGHYEGMDDGFIEGRASVKPIVRERVKKVIIFNCDEPGPAPYVPPTYQDIPDSIDIDSIRHHI